MPREVSRSFPVDCRSVSRPLGPRLPTALPASRAGPRNFVGGWPCSLCFFPCFLALMERRRGSLSIRRGGARWWLSPSGSTTAQPVRRRCWAPILVCLGGSRAWFLVQASFAPWSSLCAPRNGWRARTALRCCGTAQHSFAGISRARACVAARVTDSLMGSISNPIRQSA